MRTTEDAIFSGMLGTWYAYAVYDSPCVSGMVFQDPQDLIKAIDDALGPETPTSLAIPIVLGLAAVLFVKGKK